MYATSKLERQGRMIAALRSYKRWRWHRVKRNGKWGWDHKETPRFLNSEIKELMGLSDSEFTKALTAWNRVSRLPRWNAEKMTQKVFDFARKNKRWPTTADLKEWRKNDLVARQTMNGHQHNLDTLIARVVRDHFSRLSAQLILTIPNLTTRREAWERYGVDKLIGKSGKPFQQDDYGKLWRLPTDNRTDPHAQYLEVVNSTPEEDGTFARYFLRVPPDVVTAQEAAAWTFDREGLTIVQAT